MKKLLLFILVLFGLISFESIANYNPGTGTYNYGCGPGVPPNVCMSGGNSNGGSTVTPRYFGGVSIDPSTRKYGASWNYKNGEDARNSAKKICSESSNSDRCVSYWSSYYYTAVSISTDDQVTKFGTSDSYDSAWNAALKECQKAGGNDCEVVLMASSTSSPDEKRWGALAYNPETEKYGFSWNHYTRREANEAALKECGNSGCLVSGFQSKNGAMAVSPDGQLYFASSGKNMKDAEKEAVKGCKKKYKSKTCEIVLRGHAEAEYK